MPVSSPDEKHRESKTRKEWNNETVYLTYGARAIRACFGLQGTNCSSAIGNYKGRSNPSEYTSTYRGSTDSSCHENDQEDVVYFPGRKARSLNAANAGLKPGSKRRERQN